MFKAYGFSKHIIWHNPPKGYYKSGSKDLKEMVVSNKTAGEYGYEKDD